MLRTLCLLGIGLVLAGCQTANQRPASQVGVASLAAQDGQILGTARLFLLGSEATINVAMRNLPGAVNAVRLDQNGVCSGTEPVAVRNQLRSSATGTGPDESRRPYLPDLPNIPAGAHGVGTMSAALPIGEGDILSRIFDEDGTAIIVETAGNGSRSEAAGRAASPIACGVLQPVR